VAFLNDPAAATVIEGIAAAGLGITPPSGGRRRRASTDSAPDPDRRILFDIRLGSRNRGRGRDSGWRRDRKGAAMGVLCDSQIRELVGIEPFEDNIKRKGKVSFGVSSYGYDVRVGTVFKIFTNVSRQGGQTIVDPKSFSDDMFVSIDTRSTGKDHIVIPPNSFALAETVETINVPRNVLAICVGKSTYARCGIIVNVTPLEPEWRGKVTIEISNTTPLPAKIYANEGIAQIVFIKADRVCATSYADKGGKYQDQAGLTLPMVD